MRKSTTVNNANDALLHFIKCPSEPCLCMSMHNTRHALINVFNSTWALPALTCQNVLERVYCSQYFCQFLVIMWNFSSYNDILCYYHYIPDCSVLIRNIYNIPLYLFTSQNFPVKRKKRDPFTQGKEEMRERKKVRRKTTECERWRTERQDQREKQKPMDRVKEWDRWPNNCHCYSWMFALCSNQFYYNNLPSQMIDFQLLSHFCFH